MDTNVGNGYSSVGRRAHASGPGGSTGGISRVAAISLHTSPLAQPGTGDAGGMNVYVDQTSRRLAARGVKVEIFTRATSSDQPPVTEVVPGVLVRHIVAGPFEGLDKEELPGQLCSFAAGVMRAEVPGTTTSCTPTTGSRGRSATWQRIGGGADGAFRTHLGEGQERRLGAG